MAWLKLIRWNNLIIILLTQLLVWACVIAPIGRMSEVPFLLDAGNLLLLSLSTVLIAAAGYIINDYFDVRIDNINKPDKMVLERIIPRRLAIIMHTVLNIVALLCAAAVARKGGHYSWPFIQFGCSLLLWFYSTHFKRQFITGNLVVALLTALTIVVLLVYEPGLYSYFHSAAFVLQGEKVLANPVWVLGTYSYFAFVLTWMREIVKDMEDYRGDEAEGCVTMPIKWGLKKAGDFAGVLGVFVLVPLLMAAGTLLLHYDWALGVYVAVALVIPIVLWLFFLPRRATTAHYGQASRYLKMIMVSGIGSLIIYYLEANA